MELTKKNCMIAKNRMRGLAYTSCNCREENIDEVNNCDNYLEQLINEHFDNPPLKFEDLKEGMWVWDDKNKSYIYIYKPFVWKPMKGIRYASHITTNGAECYYMDFEENRFYRREVTNEKIQ